MATAANPIGAIPANIEAGPVPLPGIAELFAALVAGVGAEGEQAGDEPAAPEAAAEGVETLDTAATLLPMLDEQRAATPAAKLIEPPVGAAPAPAATPDRPVPTAMAQPPVMAVPSATGLAPEASGALPVETKPSDILPVAQTPDGRLPANGTGGKVRATPASPVHGDGVPVRLKTREQGVTAASPKVQTPAAPGSGADPVPADKARLAAGSILPAEASGKEPTGKAAGAYATVTPVLSQAAKTEPQAVATTPQPLRSPSPDAAPIAPNFASAPAQPQGLATEPAVSTGPRPATPSVSVESRAGEAAAQTGPSATGVHPLAAPVPPSKPTLPVAPAEESEAKPAEIVAVAGETQKSPANTKARVARYAVAPPNTAPQPDATAEAPIVSSAAETRTPIQPFTIAQPLVPPAAAPLSAPGQPVATAIAQQTLDLSSGNAWIDQIARDISQTAGKDGAMRFRLAPETLGELRVEITHSERGAHVRLAVTSEQAQQALAAAEPKLAAEARAQGVRIAETEISFAGGQSQGRELGRQAQEQAQAQSGQSPRTPRGNAATPSFTDAAEPSRSRRTDRYA